MFTTNDVQWTARADADYSLVLGPLNDSARPTCRSTRKPGSPAARNYHRRRPSVLDASGKEVMPDTNASIIRQMENDPRNASGQGRELRVFKSEMRTELAQQIVRRIGFSLPAKP